MTKKAIILLSGGLDSTTVLVLAKKQGYRLFTLSFDYGQRHRVELECACRISKVFDAEEHREVKVDLKQFGGSALTDSIDVPTHRSVADMSHEIPVTYVPARNTLFLSYALAYAEVVGSEDLFLGVNALDYSGYPDCRPEYIEAFEKTANLGTKAGVEGRSRFTIHTPLIQMTKAQIIKQGMELGLDYGLTHSCYNPNEEGMACGVCDSCLLRKKGFQEAGFFDPLLYQVNS